MVRPSRPASISPDPAARVAARLWELARPHPAVVERLHSTGAWSVWQANVNQRHGPPPCKPPDTGSIDQGRD
jgi:hypothetical protein